LLGQSGIAEMDVIELRHKVGMVMQKQQVFIGTIFDNVAIGPRVLRLVDSKAHLESVVENNLMLAGLWGEVKDSLFKPAHALSGGQQQRLCIARTLATNPRVLLLDEPCSALDPRATAKIEEVLDELNEQENGPVIIIVTHNLKQASGLSQRTIVMNKGRIVEVGATSAVFTNPQNPFTNTFIRGTENGGPS
jgi:phosphate transport system ATP-binding protein